MGKKTKQNGTDSMYEAILLLKDLDECKRFFEDLCSPTELRSMEQRYDVAVYLMQDKVYADILDRTGASSATISRVRRNILDSRTGGAMRQLIVRQGLAEDKD
ncbi:MAG: TrpR-like protein [Clostridia bacterium]|nr:TrpR-like protein [Clostridia bacterium]